MTTTSKVVIICNDCASVTGGLFTSNSTKASGGAIANYYGGAFYDAPGCSWYAVGIWNGNTPGVAGNTYYTLTQAG
jgi:predicted outer membrane repeat protein